MNETLRTTLRKLRLSGLAETLEVRLHEAGSNHLTHAEIITITGKSYRLASRGEDSKQAKAPTGSQKNGKPSKQAKAPTGSDAEQLGKEKVKNPANQAREN